jgi:hypothetical protein
MVERLNLEPKPAYVAGMPVSQERPRSNHFHGLSPEINRSLTEYRLYKLFEPRTVPLFHVAWDSRQGRGRIMGSQGWQVHLQPVGQAQMWRGEAAAVLWECYGFEPLRQRANWPENLAAFWQAVERDIGVPYIFTQPHEPTFREGYPAFLSRLGYAPDPDFNRWWSKRQAEDPASGQAREPDLEDNSLRTWYTAAETIANVRIEQYKALGLLRRVEQIADEEEQDDHFDALADIHRESCLELGLPWPPPPRAEQQATTVNDLPRLPQP